MAAGGSAGRLKVEAALPHPRTSLASLSHRTVAKMPLVPPELAEFWLGRLEGSLTALQSTPAGLAISALSLLLLAFLVLRWAASVLNFVWVYFLRPGRNLRKYGEWAVSRDRIDGRPIGWRALVCCRRRRRRRCGRRRSPACRHRCWGSSTADLAAMPACRSSRAPLMALAAPTPMSWPAAVRSTLPPLPLPRLGSSVGCCWRAGGAASCTRRLSARCMYCLAAAGLNLVLISRTESKLAEAAAQLEAAHPGVQARWVAADLCKAGPADWQRIGEAIQDLDVSPGVAAGGPGGCYDCAGVGGWRSARTACVPTRAPRQPGSAPPSAAPPALRRRCVQVGLLVNNAGLSYDHPEYLDEVDATFLADIVAINALAPTMVRPPAGCVTPGCQPAAAGCRAALPDAWWPVCWLR